MKNQKELLFVLIVFIANMLQSQITLPKLISDGVVLQRDQAINIWGWASPDEQIKILFKERTYITKADHNGDWNILLPAQSAGGPFEMDLHGNNTIKVKDILFGDVWICSGQSNMELPIERVKERYSTQIATSENIKIRQFLVPDKYNFKKEENDFENGNWTAVTPNTLLDFSAVGYFFAKHINEKYQIPIGLINSAVGGSPVESWLSENALKQFPESYAEAQKFKNDTLIEAIEASDKKRNDDWYAELNAKDKGLLHDAPFWSSTSIDDSNWDEMKLPGFWRNDAIGNVNGVVWFRKEIEIPKSMIGKQAKLMLGRIVDQDFVYVNGEFVGTTGYQYPPRRYQIKSNILKEGKNVIAIRVINSSGSGGFVEDKPYYIAVDKDTVDLKGSWKYKLGTTMQPLQGPTFIRWKPAGLYNAMIAPLLNFKIKGVLWYQGESNTGNPQKYAKAFPAMINDWRTNWKQGNFPFLFVQLANFMDEYLEPRESNWAALRQSQLETLKVPNTGMAVAIDLGEWNDIHPLNKQAVGERLALLARNLAYGEKTLMASSPAPNNVKFKKDKVIITFKNCGGGLVSKDGKPLKSFAISNDGKTFVWANAEIKGNKVIVTNDEIPNPNVIRYAWDNNPKEANLYTQEGLPSSPFELRKN